MTSEHALVLVKLLHTAIWAVMASAVVAIPVCAIRGRFRAAMWLTLLILAECLVLALNGGHCPLTDVAAQFTTDRRANFDIYLPVWLAQYNKQIFGGIFVAGELTLLWHWFVSYTKQKNGATPLG